MYALHINVGATLTIELFLWQRYLNHQMSIAIANIMLIISLALQVESE